jgi:hypothetical protein
LLTKQTLMAHFDTVVTDPRLCKQELEQWIQDVRDPLLGGVPTAASYAAGLAITAVGWCLASSRSAFSVNASPIGVEAAWRG